ncbi:MAG: transposase [Candidatus Competibacter sp.]|nr:transposase [Candidatus Competibacter sp.]
MISLQNLLDNEKCYEALRQARWPDGVRCPHCDAATLTRQGWDKTQPARQALPRSFDPPSRSRCFMLLYPTSIY